MCVFSCAGVWVVSVMRRVRNSLCYWANEFLSQGTLWRIHRSGGTKKKNRARTSSVLAPCSRERSPPTITTQGLFAVSPTFHFSVSLFFLFLSWARVLFFGRRQLFSKVAVLSPLAQLLFFAFLLCCAVDPVVYFGGLSLSFPPFVPFGLCAWGERRERVLFLAEVYLCVCSGCVARFVEAQRRFIDAGTYSVRAQRVTSESAAEKKVKKSHEDQTTNNERPRGRQRPRTARAHQL